MAHLSPEEFGEAFDGLFTRSAFRLELLDRYAAANETEPLRRFRLGLPQDPAWREPWKQFVRASVRDGKQLARVHVLGEPLSDYLEFELTCAYPANVAAGEDVRILDADRWTTLHTLSVPEYDFWLFDDCVVAVMYYDNFGNLLRVDVDRDPLRVAYYRRCRDLIMDHSVPLRDYLASLGIKEAV